MLCHASLDEKLLAKRKMEDCEVGGGIRFSKKVMVRSNPRSKPPAQRRRPLVALCQIVFSCALVRLCADMFAIAPRVLAFMHARPLPPRLGQPLGQTVRTLHCKPQRLLDMVSFPLPAK